MSNPNYPKMHCEKCRSLITWWTSQSTWTHSDETLPFKKYECIPCWSDNIITQKIVYKIEPEIENDGCFTWEDYENE